MKYKYLRQWINDLQTGLYINCVYCGHRYAPRTEEVPADALRRHVASCPEHPMSHLLATCLSVVGYIDEGGDSLDKIQSFLHQAIEKATK